MSTHPSPTKSISQNSAIFAELELNVGQWVPMPMLALCSGSWNVHSRISDLRKRGHLIEQQSRLGKQTCHSFYRLLSPSA